MMGHQTKTKQIGNPAGVDNAVVIWRAPTAAVQRPINWIVSPLLPGGPMITNAFIAYTLPYGRSAEIRTN